jgi:hypothetical protein
VTRKESAEVCKWVSLSEALTAFVRATEGTEGQQHIRRMHWYVACRLVVEGGFHPDRVTPRPPFMVARRGRVNVLHYEPESARGGEATVYGGLKTKNIDVVVDIPGLGPCLAVSMKGTLNAFRNLTNRLEEAIGDCTNIHIAYSALVYGFLHLLRANRQGPLPPHSSFLEAGADGNVQHKDLALDAHGRVTDFITNYARAMTRLTGRRDLRDDVSRYEAISVILASPYPEDAGGIDNTFPGANSPLGFSMFFDTLYTQYDLRFVYGAANLRARTQRLTWAADSPALQSEPAGDCRPRLEDDPSPV